MTNETESAGVEVIQEDRGMNARDVRFALARTYGGLRALSDQARKIVEAA